MDGNESSIVHAPWSAPLYEYIASLAQSWNTRNNIGLVVGATYPETLTRVREAAPGLWFLVPGVGAQGGELESALKAGLRKDGKGMLIPISRGISRAASPKLAAAEIRDQIVEIREQIRRSGEKNRHGTTNF
jgi:uridine monophosphate synthetase